MEKATVFIKMNRRVCDLCGVIASDRDYNMKRHQASSRCFNNRPENRLSYDYVLGACGLCWRAVSKARLKQHQQTKLCMKNRVGKYDGDEWISLTSEEPELEP